MRPQVLNNAQMMILQSFANIRTIQEEEALMQLLRTFYAERLEQELQHLWDDGTLDDVALEQLKGEHLRTPYHTLYETTGCH